MAIENHAELLAPLRGFFAELGLTRPWRTLALVICMAHMVHYAAKKYLDYRVSEMRMLDSTVRAVC
jgi:hypothetical protein